MKNSDNRALAVVAGNDGVVLIIAILMLVIFSVVGISVISLSGTVLQSAAYQKWATHSFSSAESGLTQARSDMRSFVVAAPQNGQWPAADTTLVNAVMGGAAEKSYNLTVSGQPVTFNYSITDFGTANDRTVLVTSTGAFQNAQQRVEGVVRYEPPDQTGAQECYSSQCTGTDQNSSAAVTNSLNSQASL